MFNLKNRKKMGTGFSLIELLVVIAIIGVLSAVVMTSFSTARKKGRVAKRVADMKQVQVALEFYYAANRSYPTTGGAWNCPATSAVATVNATIPGLAPTFIPVVPIDPQYVTGANTNCYFYRSDGSDYAFRNTAAEMATSQSTPNISTYPELIDSVRPTTSWKISSPVGASW